MTREPDFRELVGDDVPAEEEARLRRVHDLLVAAGPPPALPRALARAPQPRRRGWLAGLALAAALAAAAFVGGYFVGRSGSGFETAHVVPMHGIGRAAAASAVLDVAEADESHNYAVELRVRGLRPLPRDRYYVLYLTWKGKPVATCGIFRTNPKTGYAAARMTFPEDVGRFDGWTITPAGRANANRVLLTT